MFAQFMQGLWSSAVDVLEAVSPALLCIKVSCVPCKISDRKQCCLGSFCLLQRVRYNTHEVCQTFFKDCTVSRAHNQTCVVYVIYRPVQPHKCLSAVCIRIFKIIESTLSCRITYRFTGPHQFYIRKTFKMFEVVCNGLSFAFTPAAPVYCTCTVYLRYEAQIVNIAFGFAPCIQVFAKSCM